MAVGWHPFRTNGEIYGRGVTSISKNGGSHVPRYIRVDVDRYIYHNVKEYRDHKRSFYRERYRNLKNNNVRQYIKYENKQPQNASENIEK